MTRRARWQRNESSHGRYTIVEPIPELRLQLEELRASQARLLAASDAERRKLERDLHDGAQQDLIALAVNLQLARRLSASDPDAANVLLEEIGRDVHEALAHLREIATAIYPPLLAARGLAHALRAAASAAGARVEAGELARYTDEVEATVYFYCVAALRHAGAGALVHVWDEEGALRFEVRGGAGFDDRELAAMEDRVRALGGRLTISRSRVSGAIPGQPLSAR